VGARVIKRVIYSFFPNNLSLEKLFQCMRSAERELLYSSVSIGKLIKFVWQRRKDHGKTHARQTSRDVPQRPTVSLAMDQSDYKICRLIWLICNILRLLTN
jgi:hypothetical protein